VKKKIKGQKAHKSKLELITGIILLLAALIAYSNSFDCSFHWDDAHAILVNDKVHGLDFFADPGTWLRVDLRPLSLFTFALNWTIGGGNVFTYHLVNLILHILTAFIVFYLARFTIGLLANDDRLDQRLKDGCAVFIALFFLLHPLQTMAVTYIVQRMTILAALFYVLAVYLYARGRMSYIYEGINIRSTSFLVLAFLSGILGILSKQSAVTFPVAFILFELFFIRKPDGKLCRRYVAGGASLLILAFLVVVLAGKLPVETQQYTRLEYLSAQLGVLYKYFALIVLPISQNVDYYIIIEPPLIGPLQIIGILLLLALIGLSAWFFNRNKLISFGILWFLLTMSVESSIIPIRDVMMEHRMYLPLFGVGLIITGLIMRYLPYRSIISMYVASTIIFIVLAFATYSRNETWKTGLSLWQDAYDKNPANTRAINNLGLTIKVNANFAPSIQQRNMELNKAVNLFTSSIKLNADYIPAYMNRSLSYMVLGKFEQALKDMEVVAREDPDKQYLYYHIEGVAYAKQGMIKEASNSLDEAYRRNDRDASLLKWRGLVSAEMDQYQKAIDNFQASLDIDPKQTSLYVNISEMYFYLDDYNNALIWIKKAQAADEQVNYEYIQKLEELLSGQGNQIK
jgi:tetratricopeptide (TPR) repeat protein